MFTEELLSEDEDSSWDLMKVYRGDAMSFCDYEDEEPIFEREEDVLLEDRAECGETLEDTECPEEIN